MTHTPSDTAVHLPHVDGLVFRPAEAGDLEALAALVKRIAVSEQAHWYPQRSEVAAALEDPVNPAVQNSVVGVDSDGELRAYGGVQKNPDGDKAIIQGGVDPLWHRRGFGAAVLAWQESQAAARFAADNLAGGHRAAKVRSHVAEGNAGQRALLASAGYSVVRYYSQMQRSLARIPTVAVPDGISIVVLTPELSDAVRRAHNEAFADHWGSEPRSPQRWEVQMQHEHARWDLSTAAVDNATGDVVAYQLATVDPEEATADSSGEGYTELLGVRRAWRGRGLAPALLADAMTRFAAAGLDHAGLEVDTENPSGALGLYERMGYLPLRRTMVWDKLL